VDAFDDKEATCRRMHSNNFFNKTSGVKSSPVEELNNSTKIKDPKTSKHQGRVSSTVIPTFKMVF
jgi:hypothetical protein